MFSLLNKDNFISHVKSLNIHIFFENKLQKGRKTEELCFVSFIFVLVKFLRQSKWPIHYQLSFSNFNY